MPTYYRRDHETHAKCATKAKRNKKVAIENRKWYQKLLIFIGWAKNMKLDRVIGRTLRLNQEWSESFSYTFVVFFSAFHLWKISIRIKMFFEEITIDVTLLLLKIEKKHACDNLNLYRMRKMPVDNDCT